MDYKVYGRRRSSKISKRKIENFNRAYPKIKINISDKKNGIFSHIFDYPKADLWLEVGFGMGENLIHQIEMNPDVNFIGCEPYFNGLVSFSSALKEEDYSRVRVFCEDARLIINELPDESLSKVFILFPDPWPKEKHKKRRFVQIAVIDLLAKKLTQKAKLLIASDDLNYFKDILISVLNHKSFVSKKENISDCINKPAELIQTRYEKKAIEKGSETYFLEVEKK